MEVHSYGQKGTGPFKILFQLLISFKITENCYILGIKLYSTLVALLSIILYHNHSVLGLKNYIYKNVNYWNCNYFFMSPSHHMNTVDSFFSIIPLSILKENRDIHHELPYKNNAWNHRPPTYWWVNLMK